MRPVQNPLAISRRDLLRKIGFSAGAAMMYQAMSTLGFARESDYTRTDRTFRRAERHVDPDPRRRHGRPRRRVRTAPRRLHRQGARIQPSRRRTLVDLARRRRIHRARRRAAEVRIRSGPVRQSGSVANPVSPSRHARLRQAAEGAARAVQPDQFQRLPAFVQGRSAASRSATGTSTRTITATSPSC